MLNRVLATGDRARAIVRGTIGVIPMLCGVLMFVMASGESAAERPESTWEMASRKKADGRTLSLYVEAERTPGTPAFRVETVFEAAPDVAAATLMDSMASEDSTTPGERRELLERSTHGALVHTFIDLPFMFADREVAIRVEHSRDAKSGVHRIEWQDANEILPAPDEGVLRLQTVGYWEFRPIGPRTTHASYMSRAEVGGSLPAAVGDRLLRSQAIDAVERLGRLLDEREWVDVAAPPPPDA